MTRKIVELKLEEIKPYWRNPRINDKTADALTHSIDRYGYQVPIVVDEEYTIVCGHARYKALTKMKIETVSVVVMEGADHKTTQRYRILDNKIQDKSSWEMDLLIKEIEALPLYDEMMHSFMGTLDEQFAFIDEEIEDEQDEMITADDLLDIEQEGGYTTESKEDDCVLIDCPYCGQENKIPFQ